MNKNVVEEKKLSGRRLIELYIEDKNTNTELFCKNIGINPTVFKSRISDVRFRDQQLYKEYLNSCRLKKLASYNFIELSLRELIYGIMSGKTMDGKDFSINDFYRLAPLKFVDFDREILSFIKSDAEGIPDLYVFKYTKQDYLKYKYRISGQRPNCTYADNLIIFAATLVRLNRLSRTEASMLRKYINDNNITTITPISKISFINGCIDNCEFTTDDATKVFKYMEKNNYPCIFEIFNQLKCDKINSRKRR